ncbi:hypothetical protein BAUCODRAFT_34973 [Baudoinia panamericana UAMH 10762]|uniref:DUF7707 domain-containing protein n=1 Tax=Baudoinia panamericana (strain UAMH 10762) TaxID=717646 RepID=M2N851_BAUPA|nr:uncharacterized protein BAUCODRAFT_34973 [Baudoinia panamericana UAMH 10762]EMC94975.1 hypothetical protein BAUCODRAFT_34973 [Baudoinia panamericana UAMH 10762]
MQTITAISLAAAALVASVTAQQVYTINPNSVANTTRQAWCTSQLSQCPIICSQTSANSAATLANTCDWMSLTYACVCANGLSPNVSEYTQTMPYFVCTEWGNQCSSNCGSNNQCASDCRSQHPCGAQNPTRVNTSTISTSTTMSGSAARSLGGSSATTTGGQSGTVYTGLVGASSTASSGGSAAAAASASQRAGAESIHATALNVGRTFGLLGVAGVIAGGFAVFL